MAADDRIVLVVGAAGGAGLEVARLLLATGYAVVGTVFDASEAARVRAELPAIAALVELDLADGDGIAARLAPALRDIGDRLAGVIICAATCPYGPLETEPLSLLRRVIEVNAIADLAIYQACLPALRRSKGRLLVLSSFGGKLALPFIGHYVASKFTLEALADVMRREAARWGVHVIVVEPGGIRSTMVTDQIARISDEIPALPAPVAELYGDQYRQYRGMMETSYPATTTPDLIAVDVVRAFEDPDPRPRYTAGPDSAELVEKVRTSTDRELDAFVRDMYASLGDDDKLRHPGDHPAAERDTEQRPRVSVWSR